MKNFITEEQKHEIESLSQEHHDALIAYGADLYNQGVKDGSDAYARNQAQGFREGLLSSLIIELLIGGSVLLYSKRKKHSKKNKENSEES